MLVLQLAPPQVADTGVDEGNKYGPQQNFQQEFKRYMPTIVSWLVVKIIIIFEILQEASYKEFLIRKASYELILFIE